MPSPDIGLIRDLATEFRRAIEACDRTSLGIGMAEFPLGACGDATLLLGTYLREQGYGDFDYVLGYRPPEPDDEWGTRTTHAWLQRGELVVDITADQFSEIDAPVIVAEPSDWHRSFEDWRATHVADLRIYDPPLSELHRAYRCICAEIGCGGESGDSNA